MFHSKARGQLETRHGFWTVFGPGFLPQNCDTCSENIVTRDGGRGLLKICRHNFSKQRAPACDIVFTRVFSSNPGTGTNGH